MGVSGGLKRLSVSKKFDNSSSISSKAAEVMRVFGLSRDRLCDGGVVHRCSIDTRAGDIIYITGPSGAGKSVLLGEFQGCFAEGEAINLDQIKLEDTGTLIDFFDGDILGSLRFLSLAGLNDVCCLLGSPSNLSEGQKWRFRLAMAFASGKQYIFCDEFCTNLDRITACVIAYNVAKFSKRNGVTFFLASSHDDILADLLPDILLRKSFRGPCEVIYKDRR